MASERGNVCVCVWAADLKTREPYGPISVDPITPVVTLNPMQPNPLPPLNDISFPGIKERIEGERGREGGKEGREEKGGGEERRGR